MNLRRLLHLGLAVLVTASLAVAPLVAPAAARIPAAGMTDMSMPAEMPCCPDYKSPCHDCPMVATCIPQAAQAGPPMLAALPPRYAVRTTHVVRDDALAAGLDRPPPDQPPRPLV